MIWISLVVALVGIIIFFVLYALAGKWLREFKPPCRDRERQ